MDRFLRQLQREGAGDPQAIRRYLNAVRRAGYQHADLLSYIDLKAEMEPLYAELADLIVRSQTYEYEIPEGRILGAVKLLDLLTDYLMPAFVRNRATASGDEFPGELFISFSTRLGWAPVFYGDIISAPMANFATESEGDFVTVRVHVLDANSYRLSHHTQPLYGALSGDALEALESAQDVIDSEGHSDEFWSPEVAVRSAQRTIAEILGQDMSFEELAQHLSNENNRPLNVEEVFDVVMPYLQQMFDIDEDSLPVDPLFQDGVIYRWTARVWLKHPTEHLKSYPMYFSIRHNPAGYTFDLEMTEVWGDYPEGIHLWVKDPMEPFNRVNIREFTNRPSGTMEHVIRRMIERLDSALQTNATLFCGHISPYYAHCNECGEFVCRACIATGLCHEY